MAQDYVANRNRNQRRPRKQRPPAKPPTPGWVWMLCGLAIGLLAAAGAYVYLQPGGTGGAGQVGHPASSHKASDKQAKPASANNPGLPPKEKPRFDFYDKLPKYKVVIPQQQYRTHEQKKRPTVSKPGRYIIQVGSFKAYSAADSVKARLALFGLEADIQKADLKSGKIWYRVRIGPEKDTQKVNKTLKRLKVHHIDSMVMRVKG